MDIIRFINRLKVYIETRKNKIFIKRGMNMKSSDRPLENILVGRTNIIELLIVGFFIAFGTNIMVSSIIEFEFFKPKKYVFVGLGIVIMSIFYLILKVLKKRRFIKVIEGSIIYEMESNSIIDLPRYDYSRKIASYFQYAFKENVDIKTLWEKNKLSNIYEKNIGNRNNISSVKLLNEVTEYIVLDRLSLHLNDYFSNDNIDNNNIVKLKREDLSDIIIKNRFLDLFSKPMNERSGFLNEEDEDSDDNIIMSSVNGHFFNKFELILPKNSKIFRNRDSSITIKNKRFSIRISVSFDGMSTSKIPYSFIESILGMNITSYNQFEIIVKVDVKFNLITYISLQGWKYYNWIDSLLNELEKNISSKQFAKSIDWEKNEIIINYINDNVLKLIEDKVKIEEKIDS